MSKFNELYKLFLEEINTNTILKALDKIEKNQSNNPKNAFISAFGKKIEELSNHINSSDNSIESQINDIINILRLKGANRLAIKDFQVFLNNYKSQIPILHKYINSVKYQSILENLKDFNSDNSLDNDFLNYIFDYKRLNKTTSTANIGRGQLLLALLIQGATINGLDDLNIHGDQWNVKYIKFNRFDDYAIISLDKNDPKCKQLVSLLGNDKKNQANKDNENTTDNINENNENNETEIKLKSVLYINDNSRKTYILNKIINLLEKYTSGVKGYILIGINSNKITFKTIKTEDIITDPLKYINSLHNSSSHFGFYFNGDFAYANA